MHRIRRLPEDLASQIAAGEVVERPASVVKELVENSLDAGARRVSITVEQGGKRLVRVEDDGEGMEPEDAQLALERHATSKLRRAEDLEAILTLGFRGEALPSIASVSHFTIRTKTRPAAVGTEIRVHAGTVASIVEVGMPEGTSVEVADLFYNLPARRKFLKSDAAEAAQVSRLTTQLALGYPEVGFTLVSSGRRVLQCPPVAGSAERFYQLYGDRPDLLPVSKEAGGIVVTGYVAALADQGPTRGPQNVFVNRRIVKDRTIAHAIIDAYSASSVKERSPEVHLFLEMSPETLDVNVHPTKAEVRFRHQSLVHEVVRRAVAQALGQAAAPELQLRSPVAASPQPWSPAIPGIVAVDRAEVGEPSMWAPEAATGDATVTAGELAPGGGPLPPAMPLGGRGRIRPMVPLGQFRETFIIAVDEEGVAIVDQHVAHERVLFERALERLGTGRLESQRLLEPRVFAVPPEDRQTLLHHASELDRLGFEVAEFGSGSVMVSAVPVILAQEDVEGTIRALATDLQGLGRGATVQEALGRVAATTACHAAVKANCRLTHEKMVHILEELRKTEYSTVCPHGRPVMLRLTRREIERNFQRI
jgi:DNA mismatch repair protein MutL